MEGEINVPPMAQVIYAYGRDPDHVLELLGNGACPEYSSVASAKGGSPDERGPDWKLFRITVEEVED